MGAQWVHDVPTSRAALGLRRRVRPDRRPRHQRRPPLRRCATKRGETSPRRCTSPDRRSGRPSNASPPPASCTSARATRPRSATSGVTGARPVAPTLGERRRSRHQRGPLGRQSPRGDRTDRRRIGCDLNVRRRLRPAARRRRRDHRRDRSIGFAGPRPGFWDRIVDGAESIVYRLMFQHAARRLRAGVTRAFSVAMAGEVRAGRWLPALVAALENRDAPGARQAADDLLSPAPPRSWPSSTRQRNSTEDPMTTDHAPASHSPTGRRTARWATAASPRCAATAEFWHHPSPG